jgi:hypothetical protein
VTAAAVLFGACLAYAADPPSLSVSKTEAASGEDVPFKITGTEAFSTYELKVEDQVVARGSDPAGNGVDDKFKMPDLGSSEEDVTITATVQQPSSPDPFVGTTTMRYVLFPTSPTGPTTDPQPEPVPLTATPAPQATPAPASTTTTPTTPKSTRGTHHTNRTTSGNDHSSTPTGGTGNSNSTPVTTPTNTPTSGGSGRTPHVHTPRHPSAPTALKPSGPVGTAGFQPPTGPPGGGLGGGPPTTTPITGTATITGSGGFPTAALVALALLALAAIGVGARRLRFVDWHRFAIAGPHDPDEMRIGALSRAARSGAEAQEAIAVRKASRRAS